MSRRLVNRARSSGDDAFSTPAPPSHSHLPDYEPLEFPLDNHALKALQDLSTNRKHNKYTKNLASSTANLGHSVSDLQECFYERRSRLDKRKKQRKDKAPPEDDAQDLKALEAQLDDYACRVDECCHQAEATLRRLLDQRARLEDEASILTALCEEAAQVQAEENARLEQKQREQQTAIEIAQANGEPLPQQQDKGHDNDNDSKPLPLQSLLHSFHQHQRAKQDDYERLTLHQRYALNNEYASFKRLWHDAAQGGDGPPLPDASRWFSAKDEPVLPTVAPQTEGQAGGQAGLDDESDDDIAVAREVTSLRCPLSLCEFVEPYSNKKCKHTFEKAAIWDYLSQKNEAQCPQTGCSQMFAKADFNKDFFLDRAILRRLQRKRAPNRLDNMDVEDTDEDNTIGEFQECSQRSVKGRGKR